MITGSVIIALAGLRTVVALSIGVLLAGAAGSISVKYVNSSYFWVCASLSRMPLKAALISKGGVTPATGIFAMAVVY